jgi:hypothetical protein
MVLEKYKHYCRVANILPKSRKYNMQRGSLFNYMKVQIKWNAVLLIFKGILSGRDIYVQYRQYNDLLRCHNSIGFSQCVIPACRESFIKTPDKPE